MFRIPEVRYPLVISSIGSMLSTGHDVRLECNECRRVGHVNLVSLSYRFGMDFELDETAARRLFHCPDCRAAGRPDRNMKMILEAPTASQSPWPRKASAYEKAKGL